MQSDRSNTFSTDTEKNPTIQLELRISIEQLI